VGLVVALVWTLTGHARALRQGVEADLAEAVRLRERAHYAEARAVLGQAEARLDGGRPADLAEAVRQAKQDLDLALRLEEIPLLATGVLGVRFDWPAVVRAYREAFAGYGIDLEALDPAEAAARVRASAIREPLVVALDHWAALLTKDNERVQRERLLAVAGLADGDAARAELRRVLADGDREALEEVAGRLEAGSTPPTTLTVVAKRLWELPPVRRVEEALAEGLAPPPGAPAGVGAVLLRLRVAGLVRRGQQAHPADFWLNLELPEILRGRPGRQEEALGYLRAAVAVRPDCASAHNNLGVLLAGQGKAAAEREYREALRISPDLAEAHYNLGILLAGQGKTDEAERQYREALRLNPDFAEAHYNLGLLLAEQGKFAAALGELQRAEQVLPPNDPRLPQVQANIRHCQVLAELDRKLPDLLHNKLQPTDAAEGLSVAWLCQQPYTQLYAAAARFYSDAFASDPKLADDLGSGHRYNRYNAACAAALAGCGQGKEAPSVDDQEGARLRRQALTWLRADLDAWAKLLDDATPEQRAQAAEMLKHWQEDTDLAGVRDKEALEKLPEGEREAWGALWTEVEALRQKAAEKGPR
jgi:serine/threonine-protein kinase